MTELASLASPRPPQLAQYSIQHHGFTREALLFVPQKIARGRAIPLVLAFHGGASDHVAMAQNTALHHIAEREGFIVAYPAGTTGLTGRFWLPGGRARAREKDDVGFTQRLIDDLEYRYSVDQTRIFAVGMSIGGSLVYELACCLSHRLAAVAVVGGTMTVVHRTPANPLPVIHIHGLKDRRVPYEGGRGERTTGIKEWLSVKACIEQWREINGCASTPEIVHDALRGVTAYKHKGSADVELWLVAEGGHSWPGGRRVEDSDEEERFSPHAFSASETIWRFFAAHPQREGLKSPR